MEDSETGGEGLEGKAEERERMVEQSRLAYWYERFH